MAPVRSRPRCRPRVSAVRASPGPGAGKRSREARVQWADQRSRAATRAPETPYGIGGAAPSIGNGWFGPVRGATAPPQVGTAGARIPRWLTADVLPVTGSGGPTRSAATSFIEPWRSASENAWNRLRQHRSPSTASGLDMNLMGGLTSAPQQSVGAEHGGVQCATGRRRRFDSWMACQSGAHHAFACSAM